MSYDRTVFLALHVPKCAGRTIERHVEKHLHQDECWITTRNRVRVPLVSPRAYRHPTAGQLARVRFASGHYLGRSVESCFPGARFKRAVLLRDPLSFMLSYYNFRMMRYIRDGWKPYSFELHVRSLPCDPIAHFLLSRWLEVSWAQLLLMRPGQKYELLNEALSEFWYVADYSRCDELVGSMSGELGISPVAERLNTQESWLGRIDWRPLRSVSPEMRREVEERTRLDRALWETWGEAGSKTGSVRPVPLKGAARLTFPLTEAGRPAVEIARRYQRGWF